jgi:anhydro-N-acetylmuramic acid kinase
MNKKFQLLKAESSKLAIGLLSGTSVDGIDAVLLKLYGAGVKTRIKVLDFATYKIPGNVKAAVMKNSSVRTARIDEICRLNAILGKLFADSAIKICRKNRIKPSQVDFIGSHGQTIHHLPKHEKFLGFRQKSTIQIGDPSVIANLTGITTVGDFRMADCSVDGDGAPLVPYLDYILFTSKTLNRALLNIGGISNITILPKNCMKSDVLAFDTGPGNMLIDGIANRLFHKPFDKSGVFAKKGRINIPLMNWLRNDKYYREKPPKSTGREHYNERFLTRLLKISKGISNFDIISTVTEFTVYSIWYNYEKYFKGRTKIDELIISGGGAKNSIIVNGLRDYFKGVKIKHINQSGITIDNKEAVLFAVLANECMAGNSANMPSVTGAKRSAVLGKVCIALN